MQKQVVYTEDAPKPIGPYSQAVWAGDLLFVSGQIALDAATGNLYQNSIEEETNVVMNNIQAILREAQLNTTNIVKTTIFLKDMNDFGKVNEVYSTFFKNNFPARETVQVSRLPKDVNVEISVIAAKL